MGLEHSVLSSLESIIYPLVRLMIRCENKSNISNRAKMVKERRLVVSVALVIVVVVVVIVDRQSDTHGRLSIYFQLRSCGFVLVSSISYRRLVPL